MQCLAARSAIIRWNMLTFLQECMEIDIAVFLKAIKMDTNCMGPFLELA